MHEPHESAPATTRRTVAVLLAGGVGTRVGLDTPKQLIKIAGRTILEHTLRAFSEHPQIDEIVIMMAPGHLDAVRAIVTDGGHHKVSMVLEGGATRNDTTQKALAMVDPEANLLLHDAVRPLISPVIISECIAALETHDAVDVAIPTADTVIEVDDDEFISAIPTRSRLRRGQTPQAFRVPVLQRAYDVAAGDPDFQATDDCGVVLKYLPEVPIKVVRGEERNMKVTEPVDVYIADKLFQFATPQVPDIAEEALGEALADKVVVVLGGSYGIGAELVELAARHGARTFAFSRSVTGTHVQRREDLQQVVDTVLAEAGRIDYVINTAGMLARAPLTETSDEDIWASTEINYIAPVLIAQTFHPHLAATGGGLLFYTSSSYTRGRGSYSLYSSAKAAVVNLTQALADEWAPDGIRVNVVNPERTGTPMRSKAFGTEPAGSLLDAGDVATRSLQLMAGPGTGHVLDLRRDFVESNLA